MLSALLKYAKKVLIVLIMASMLLTGFSFNNYSYADYSENTVRDVDIVIRAGEWANTETAKSGKRYVWGNDINISKHGLTAKDIPTDIPLRKGEDGNFYISEADINLKTARAIAKKLSDKGIDVDLQYSTDGSTDLNAAGRIAAKKLPEIYLSIHHNSFEETSKGYFFISNEGDSLSAKIANKLSEVLRDNGMVPQMSNRTNANSYIGELNKVAAEGRISILGELGFFSNPEELKYIMSDEYVDYVSTKLANELYETIKSNQSTKPINTKETTEEKATNTQKVIGIKNKNYNTGMYRVLDDSLNIRKGPGVGYDVVEEITDHGAYTVVEVENGWGKLASGKGWISLKGNYTEFVYSLEEIPVAIEISFVD